jgi:hypothetical protein
MQAAPNGDVWKLRMTGTPALLPPTEAFPVLSSGLVGIIPSVYDPVTGAAVVDSGYTLLAPGAATFQSCRAYIRTARTSPVDRSLGELELDMRSATLTAQIAGGRDDLRLTHALRVLLHTPSVAMHTVGIEGIADANGAPIPLPSALTLEHEVREGRGDDGVEFEGVLLSAGGAQHYVSQATAPGAVCVTAYRLSGLALAGLPIHREPAVSGGGVRRAVSSLALTPSDPAATSAQVHVYTCTLRCSDGDGIDGGIDGETPTRRVALALARRMVLVAVTADPAAVVARHTAAWASRWQTYVDVPVGASDRVRSALVYAAFNLHSHSAAFRGAATVATALGRGDDFLTPALIYVSPAAARDAIDARGAGTAEHRLGAAAAAAEGLGGVRYPYGPAERRQVVAGGAWAGGGGGGGGAGDVSSHGVTRVHGTLMAAVNAWNYYRVTGDREWLAATGYRIIASVADMIASLAVRVGSVYHMTGAVALTDNGANAAVRDTALVVAGTVAALRAACEAAYALGYTPKQVWLDVRFGLTLPALRADANGAPLALPYPIARYAGEDLAAELAAAGSADAEKQQAAEEVLLVLAEPLGTLIESDLGINLLSGISRTHAVWSTDAVAAGLALAGTGTDMALRALVQLLSLAQAMQVDASKSGAFLTRLDAFLDTYSDYSPGAGGFGNLCAIPGASANDAELSAVLLLTFITGIGGAAVQGGFGESGLQYSTMGISLGTSCVMPAAWERLVVRGMGPQAVDGVLLNRGIVGTAGTAGGSGGSGSSNITVGYYGNSNLVYWSTDTLTR